MKKDDNNEYNDENNKKMIKHYKIERGSTRNISPPSPLPLPLQRRFDNIIVDPRYRYCFPTSNNFNGDCTEPVIDFGERSVFGCFETLRDAIIKLKRGRIIRQQFSFAAKFIAHLARRAPRNAPVTDGRCGYKVLP